MKFLSIQLLVFATVFNSPPKIGGEFPSPQRRDIYHGNWIDLNKNGVMDPYEDPAVPADRRIEDLLSRMTMEEKTAQMATLYGYGRVLKDELPTPQWKQEIWKDGSETSMNI